MPDSLSIVFPRSLSDDDYLGLHIGPHFSRSSCLLPDWARCETGNSKRYGRTRVGRRIEDKMPGLSMGESLHEAWHPCEVERRIERMKEH